MKQKKLLFLRYLWSLTTDLNNIFFSPLQSEMISAHTYKINLLNGVVAALPHKVHACKFQFCENSHCSTYFLVTKTKYVSAIGYWFLLIYSFTFCKRTAIWWHF